MSSIADSLHYARSLVESNTVAPPYFIVHPDALSDPDAFADAYADAFGLTPAERDTLLAGLLARFPVRPDVPSYFGGSVVEYVDVGGEDPEC